MSVLQSLSAEIAVITLWIITLRDQIFCIAIAAANKSSALRYHISRQITFRITQLPMNAAFLCKLSSFSS